MEGLDVAVGRQEIDRLALTALALPLCPVQKLTEMEGRTRAADRE